MSIFSFLFQVAFDAVPYILKSTYLKMVSISFPRGWNMIFVLCEHMF